MKFTHLHVHSSYSLLDGLPKIHELVDYVKELGMDSVALTDHGVMYGAVEFFKEAKKKGIKPIIGNEMYCAVDRMDQKRPNIDQKSYHLVLLVKSEEGYKNLVKLTTKAHLEGYYYKPRIDEELLSKHSEGLIALTACVQGKIPQLILSNKLDEAEEKIKKFQNIFGKDDFYLELQHHPEIEGQEKVNNALIALSKKTGAPLVATCDTHYLRKEDAEAQDILMLINTGADRNNPDRLTMKNIDLSLKSSEEMEKLFKDVPEAITNTKIISDKCSFEFKLGETKLPKYEVPAGKTDYDLLVDLSMEGLKKRYGKITKEMTDRLNYELAVIKKTGFSSYFLIVQDFINWAKGNRIVVGPGRGSAPGSLVSYCLNITNVDPLKYNLLFERFLNIERISMPDIDVDFTDRRRDEVLEYISKKYGKDKVAQIITFGTMAARAVIRDVGRSLGYPYDYCDKAAKMIPLGFNLRDTLKNVKEFKAFYEEDSKARELIDLSLKLEGCARHSSKHACGVVISKDPLDTLVPCQHPNQNDESIVTQYDGHGVEDVGLLKMDFLGLKNLTVIEDTLNRVYKVQNISIDIDKIPLDDEETFKIFQKADTTGVFQCESGGFKRYLKELKATEFEDIIAMVALYRPGPMELIPTYINRKNGVEDVKYLHPTLEPILKNTHGILVYQEQVMRIAQDLAGFTLGEADVLRKAIGKKIKELMMAQKKKLIDGMVKNNIDKKIAIQIWDWIEPFAAYSFNRSHAASYATIAYQTAYLKAHFPVEFMSAVLISEKSHIDRISILIDECKKMEIEILPPDINESFREFSVVPKERKIRFGLFAIKNVGEPVVNSIIDERKNNGPYLSIEDFISRSDIKILNKKSMESLVKTGAFDRFIERNKLLKNLEELLSWAREGQRIKKTGQKGLFDSILSDKKTDIKLNLSEAEEATTKEKLTWEKGLLGLYISTHPLEEHREFLQKKTLRISKVVDSDMDFVDQKIRMGGIISTVKKIITKKGKPMMFLSLEDLTGKIEVVVFPRMFEQFGEFLEEDKIVLICGRIDQKDGTPKLICEQVEEIIES